MKRTSVVLAAIAAAGLSLTACGSTEKDADASGSLTLPATSSAAASTSSAAATTAATNARGNIVKQLGEVGGINNPDGGEDLISFAVDSITPDPACDSQFHSDPENGHLVQLQMRVTTSAELTQDAYDTLGSSDFNFIGSDGVTKSDLGTMSAFDCFESDNGMFTQDPLGPSQSYTGYVIVDVPETAGTLIFKPSWGQSGGWEYAF
jgi:hypothetical protein